MPVTDTSTDTATHSLTITARFEAPPTRVWAVYDDPRQLESVWGPPTYPATFVDHDLRPGGRMTYYMTSPEGERFGGWWLVGEVEQPRRFTFDDGFADSDLEPDPTKPVSHCVYSFEGDGEATVATYVSTFDSAEALEQVLAMGIEEGARSAIDQIDALLAAQPA
ncbi:MAG: uncharacterized protein JWP82_2680 [Humibacillus sp.]|nr:uncharacterized protein [Humibacillus sp.]